MLKLCFSSSLVTSISLIPNPGRHPARPSLGPTWKSQVSPWLLEGVFLAAWSKPNVTVTSTSKPLLSCLGRGMLSLLLWCLFNKYVVITCLWERPLGPLSISSMIYVANKLSVLCLFTALTYSGVSLTTCWRQFLFLLCNCVICVFQWNVNPSTEDDVKNYPNK